MKLILQIALGVFIGTFSSQLILDGWDTYQESITRQATEKLQAEQEKVRIEQGEHIRNLLQGRQSNTPSADYVPDDAQMETLKKK